VRSIKLNRERIAVVLLNSIFLYNLKDLKLLDFIETCDNESGLCSLNTQGDQNILATLEKRMGYLNVNLYEQKKSTKIRAH